MIEVYICDVICMLIGWFGGVFVVVWLDDFVVYVIWVLVECNFCVDWGVLDDVVMGCVNQVGEDNCNVVCMVVLLVGFLQDVGGLMVNCFCGFGFDVVGSVVWVIWLGDVEFFIVGGVESMSCVLFVMFKVEGVFLCWVEIYDIMIGWCFVNFVM